MTTHAIAPMTMRILVKKSIKRVSLLFFLEEKNKNKLKQKIKAINGPKIDQDRNKK
jgi:hypothetical protein